MTDKSWEAYEKLAPTSVVVTVDRHGAVNLWDGPVFFSPNANVWCAKDSTVKKTSVGLMATTGDFSPETAYRLKPGLSEEASAPVLACIRGSAVNIPVPNQWTGTLDNTNEMTRMQSVIKMKDTLPTTIGMMEPDYQTATPTVFEQSIEKPSVVDRGGMIAVESYKSTTAPAPLVVQSNVVKASVSSQLRTQAAKLMELADSLEKPS